ncbi:RagB/SusD family nutrient uptake outer membrane protein [Cyclobacterium plantarum]|uniref:RagB/SusD family nutrient uptake outer membrane protein n=1 Tax=Cyclobacterium plantarum TaxID=2716263 RepID=UPI003F71C25D
MKTNRIILYIFSSLLLFPLGSCDNDFLEFYPEDKITSANFPQNEGDIKLLLNGVYAHLRENSIYNEGLFGFGVLDGATPNAFTWGNTPIARAGNGQLNSSDGSIVNFRWTRSYGIIFRANYLLDALEGVELNEEQKTTFRAEARFLRGLAYSILAESFGGVPIILEALTTEEARNITRSTRRETWDQAIADYDMAIDNLDVDAPEVGRATKGAALGMKMRALLYQGNYDQVLEVIDEIDQLGIYDLFPSYEGLFKLENENNQEVIFDIQYITGENSQGSLHDQYCGTGTGSWTRGSRYVPTDDLVNAYEMIDGSAVDPSNPYEGRDPRLGFTVVVPGAYILGYRFPNYEYPGGAFNHPGNRLKHLSTRKYRIEPESDLPPSGQSSLNNIILRYADVILSKAEAIIETNGNIDEAITLINRIRTERDDVKITPLPMGLSQEEARERLRHERRIEFAMEGLYWADIKRWNIGSEIYPVEVRDHTGSLLETKFPNGYLDFYQLLPIPDSEIALNENLEQNPGW